MARIGVNVEMSELTGRKPRFRTGDIVYGYLRPYLNKVWVADFDGLCSVNTPIPSAAKLPTPDLLHGSCAAHVIWKRAPIGDTPGQLPRIRLEEVAAVQIGLPPLAEQRAVAKRIETEMKAFTGFASHCKPGSRKLSFYPLRFCDKLSPHQKIKREKYVHDIRQLAA